MKNITSIIKISIHHHIVLSFLSPLLLGFNNVIAQINLYTDATKFINGSLTENIEWFDNKGEIINAHDGGIICVKNKYYWYGLALRPLGQTKDENNGAATTIGINLYSSEDLHNWKYEGVILPVTKDLSSPLRAPMRLERPKMVYNHKNKKFVLWFHYVGYPGTHGQSIGLADAGVAVSDSITGPFKFLGYQRPIDDAGAVKDCSLFLDDDDKAYFIYDRKLDDSNRCLHIVMLSDDYLNVTNQYVKIDIAFRREAPIIVKNKGVYYLITSGVSGWRANAAKVYKANKILGQWAELGNPCIGEGMESTYNAQGTFAFQVKGIPDLWIIMLERHNTENFIRCSYVWLPLVFTKNGGLVVPYKNEWDIPSYLKEN